MAAIDATGAQGESEQDGTAELVGGRYRLHTSVGRGGMAEVFRATDTHTGAVVALKCLHPARNPDQRQRATAHLEREFHTLCQLVHPRVVTAYDYGLDPERGPFYTMELLDGGDLEQR
jgi:serine/threonine-protein kinase